MVEICAAPYQFAGYDPNHPVTERNLALVYDVVNRWVAEKNGATDVGRTLPSNIHHFRAASNPGIGEWHNDFFGYSEIIYGTYLPFGTTPLCNPYTETPDA